jgi:stearoyl-CoA desaturase (delta-9 desaturase)
VNSFAHVFGRRRYDTNDTSRNSLAVALLTGGEGWHNNHHHHPLSARQGFFWWEVDLTYTTLRVLAWLGLVHDLRQPTAAALEARRVTMKV